MSVTRSSHVNTLLAAYTDALDTLPFRIAHHFSDLRELDAVLGGSILSLNRKLHTLINALDDPLVPARARFELLRDVAEDSQKLRMGNEDKIRLAAAAVDEIEQHITHSSHLLQDASLLNPSLPPLLPPPSVFPHMAPLSGSYVKPVEDKRKSHKRGANEGKRKTLAADGEEEDGGGRATPKRRRKEGAGAGGEKEGSVQQVQQGRLDGRPERERRQAHPLANELAQEEEEAPRRKDGKRRKAASPAEQASSPLPTGAGPQIAAPVPRPAGSISASHRAKLEGAADGPATRTSSRSERRPSALGVRTVPFPSADLPGSAAGNHIGLAGEEGMEEGMDLDGAGTEGGEAEGEGEGEGGETDDQNPYCFCRKPSFGEMIGCEDDDCDYQWFHIGCVNVADPDMFDKWYCEACQKRTGKRPILKGQGKGGSKKSSGANGANGNGANGNGNGNGNKNVAAKSRSARK
ncbi:hypothetical protein CALVIDRAFT_536588 [Calocera viscosa TUFC12733]|uniref:Chromatin modification-related protein n=1 Tax=Calocera viscosa (strain TUFC12733) TaxID=1330018 RepID=A0A167MW56_CALVF|nr:hypothetical protein CALVIDRAFT_536588 [Calocera viscosa TUFC12733]